ncbi:MAG: hypothetical protein ACOYBQ_10200 [Fluviibacter sp.]
MPRTLALTLTLAFFAAPQLTACTAIAKKLENKAVCSLDSTEADVISQWGAFGIATKLRDADVPYICPPTKKQ